jgi:sodium-dependent dicarboxylate transporter 2/3/5
MMFGGGLALAAGIGESGLADWLGEALKPLAGVHPVIIAAAITALVILITEFASNVATASGVMPVVAGMVTATGADPWLLAMSASIAASWGFMMPSGTGPNAIAWATKHVALPKMLRAGLLIDLFGIPLIVGMVWAVSSLH